MNAYTPEEYWSRLAHDCAEKDPSDFSAVLHPNAPRWFNAMMDRMQVDAWERAIDRCNLQPGHRVLDIGSGMGRWLSRFSNRRLEVHGVDCTPEMLQIAKNRGVSAHLAAGDAERLPFADESFDAITSVTVVQHIPFAKQETAIEELIRVLRPSGRLILLELIRGKDAHIFPARPSEWIARASTRGLRLDTWFGEEYLLLDRAFVALVLSVRRMLESQFSRRPPGVAQSNPADTRSSRLARITFWTMRRVTLKLSSWMEPLVLTFCPPEWATHGVFVFLKSKGGEQPRVILGHSYRQTEHRLLRRASSRASEWLKSFIREIAPRPVRNWLRSPVKSLEWLWDSMLYSWGSTRTLRLDSDWAIVCHPRAYRVGLESRVLDPEQAEEFRAFLAHCHIGMLLFDVGAHFGFFSLAAARHEGRAIAVDPSPVATQMIATQAALNQCTDRIFIIQAAVDDQSCAIDMLDSGVFSYGYFVTSAGRPAREVTHVEAVTLDDVASKWGSPSHIKIDVEGHEAAVLRGARALLSRSSPLIFLELHNQMLVSKGGDPHSALNELAYFHYRTFGLDGAPISRDAILAKPLVRIVAKRVGH